MADISMFGQHFANFGWVKEDVAQRETVGVGVFSGYTDVRGFADYMEVLTSVGWVSFSVLKDILIGEERLYQKFETDLAHHLATGGSRNTFPVSEYVYTPLLVASVSPYSFKFDGKVSEGVGSGGRVVFVQPTGFSEWVYERPAVSVKMRGLDFVGSVYGDVVAKKRWREEYGFVSLDALNSNRYGGYYYTLLNRFSKDVGGGFVPSLGNVLDGFVPLMKVASDVYVSGRGAVVNPVDNVSTVKEYSGSMFNVIVEPYHTVIVRRERERRVDGSVGNRPLSGKPVVVGDGFDKNVFVGYKSLDKRSIR